MRERGLEMDNHKGINITLIHFMEKMCISCFLFFCNFNYFFSEARQTLHKSWLHIKVQLQNGGCWNFLIHQPLWQVEEKVNTDLYLHVMSIKHIYITLQQQHTHTGEDHGAEQASV